MASPDIDMIRQIYITDSKGYRKRTLTYTAFLVIAFVILLTYVLFSADTKDFKRPLMIILISAFVLILVLLYIYNRFETKNIRQMDILLNVMRQNYIDPAAIEQLDRDKNIDDAFKTLLSNLANSSIKEKNLEIAKRSAQLDSLQQQINPHFLYNTLDTIRGQAHIIGQPSIETMALSLSKIFRYSISSHNDLVPLFKELEIIDNYLYIQNVRFGNKFTLIPEIDEDMINEKFPKMMLQPLIENAIHHGLEPKLSKGSITVRANRTKNHMMLTIIDDGVGIDENRLIEINHSLLNPSNPIIKKGAGHSIGLSNINSRLKLIYGPEAKMTVYSLPNIGTSISLSIPAEET